MATTTIIIETTNDNTDVTETTISFEEIEHTTQLVKDGCVNYYAPIEIEHSGQLETLNITWNDCRTWHIGSERVTVYLCPADEATYRFLLGGAAPEAPQRLPRRPLHGRGKAETLDSLPGVEQVQRLPLRQKARRPGGKHHQLGWLN